MAPESAGRPDSRSIPPVAHHDPGERTAATPCPGFQEKALAEIFGGLDGAGIGGGIGSADRVAPFVPGGLSEYASQLDFAGMGRLALGFALPTHRLFLHHR